MNSLGEERLEARCEGCQGVGTLLCGVCKLPMAEHPVSCDRTWSGRGTIESRRKAHLAQKHSDRTGHRISVEHANPR